MLKSCQNPFLCPFTSNYPPIFQKIGIFWLQLFMHVKGGGFRWDFLSKICFNFWKCLTILFIKRERDRCGFCVIFIDQDSFFFLSFFFSNYLFRFGIARAAQRDGMAVIMEAASHTHKIIHDVAYTLHHSLALKTARKFDSKLTVLHHCLPLLVYLSSYISWPPLSSCIYIYIYFIILYIYTFYRKFP